MTEYIGTTQSVSDGGRVGLLKPRPISEPQVASLLIQATVYMACCVVPFLLSLPVWWSVRVALVLAVVVATLRSLKSIPSACRGECDEPLEMGRWSMLACFVLAVGLFVLSPLSFNNNLLAGDWSKHHLILGTLAENPFAPHLDDADLVYYHGIYTPVCWVTWVLKSDFGLGKAATLRLATFLFALWCSYGLWLGLMTLPVALRRFFSEGKSVRVYWMTFLLVLCFAGLDLWHAWYREAAGLTPLGDGGLLKHSEWSATAGFFAYEAFIVNVRWVPQHLVTTLLGLNLLMAFSRRLDALPWSLYWLFLLAGSAFVALGTIPLALAAAICRSGFVTPGMLWRKRYDLVVTIVGGLVVIGYYTCKGHHPNDPGFALLIFREGFLRAYLLLILIDIVPYVLLAGVTLWTLQRRPDPVAVLMLVLLFVLPLFKVGKANDLVMRGGMPAQMFCLYYLCTLVELALVRRSRVVIGALATLLLLVVPSVVNEYANAVLQTRPWRIVESWRNPRPYRLLSPRNGHYLQYRGIRRVPIIGTSPEKRKPGLDPIGTQNGDR